MLGEIRLDLPGIPREGCARGAQNSDKLLRMQLFTVSHNIRT